MKLNLGDNGVQHEGYIGLDIERGTDVSELTFYEDGSADEIRASHVLEHLPLASVKSALTDWVRVLKPGGVLKIAVPDFRLLAEAYLAGQKIPIQSYIMGGQSDEHDFHKAIFDREALTAMLREIGLIGIRSWHDLIEDCHTYPISLNLAGTKPHSVWPKVAAVISVPRLGFNDFWAAAYDVLSPLMPLRKVTGAYWERDLTTAIEDSLESKDPEWILTADYDTVFTRDQVISLLDLAMRYPHADAIAPLQTARHHDQPMFTAITDDGQPVSGMSREDLERGEMLRIRTAHFGLTLIRASKLKTMPKPWFRRTYGEDGRDPDVQFWLDWHALGNTLYGALRVPVGHCDLVVRWPGQNFENIYQTTVDFNRQGAPENVWR